MENYTEKETDALKLYDLSVYHHFFTEKDNGKLALTHKGETQDEFDNFKNNKLKEIYDFLKQNYPNEYTEEEPDENKIRDMILKKLGKNSFSSGGE